MDSGNTTRAVINAKLLGTWPEVLINRCKCSGKRFSFLFPLGMQFICAMSRETHFSVRSESELFIICLV